MQEENMKNKIKIAVTIILTIWVQFEAVKENGYWGIGGNILMPFLCYLVFWTLPFFVKHFIEEFKKMN